MGEKLIDADKIEGLKVRYSTMEHYMREDTDSLVKSSASDAFREATAKAKEMAKDLTETVDALDEFLTSAAREFRAMDHNIASVIGGEKYFTCLHRLLLSYKTFIYFLRKREFFL